MINVGDTCFVRDNYIAWGYMVFQATVLAIGYEKDSSHPMVYLLSFEGSFKHEWVPVIGIKKQ